ncbi:MAG: replication-relaxation family protein [Abitibacteriaceae bacterium]|nr:replication-relaxation family protein [Abditibacteriaceae bacterium]
MALSKENRATRQPLPRYRQSGQESPALVLQERDVKLLEEVWRYRLLTTSHIELLRSLDPDPELRFVSRLTLTRRLKLLYHHKYLQRIARPLSKGSLEPVYVLDSRGAALLSRQHSGVTAHTADLARNGAALKHCLEVVQVRVALAAACGRSSLAEVLQWQDAEEVKFSAQIAPTGARKRKVSVLPDGFFALRVAPQRFFYFLQIDSRGETPQALADTCNGYYSYWQSGGFARDFTVPPAVGFRVLFIAPTPKRVEAILSAARSLNAGHALFWVTTQEHITPQQILNPIWHGCASGQLTSILGTDKNTLAESETEKGDRDASGPY